MRLLVIGEWRPVRLADESYRASARVWCPECGAEAGLHDHTIADDGTVEPSVICPHPGCSFHEMVKLDGWQEHKLEGKP